VIVHATLVRCADAVPAAEAGFIRRPAGRRTTRNATTISPLRLERVI
jgi:hypothetical protein